MNDDRTLNDGVVQCPLCRSENPAGAEVCAGCGRSIADEEWMSGTLLDSEIIDAPPAHAQEEGSHIADESTDSPRTTLRTID